MYKSHTISQFLILIILCSSLTTLLGCSPEKSPFAEETVPSTDAVEVLPTETMPHTEAPETIAIAEQPTTEPAVTESLISECETEDNSEISEPEEPTVKLVDFEPVDETVYAKADVNIRKGPGTEYDKITYLPAGDSVRRIGIGSNGWSKVIFHSEEAYINSSYLTKKKPNDNTAPTTPPAAEPPETVIPTVVPTMEPPAPPTDAPATPEAPHEHNYSANKVHSPTCESDGYTVYTCSCGDSYHSDIIAAAGHSWGDWVETVAATVDSEGEQVRTCKNCQATETQPIPKKEAEKIDTAVLTAYGNNYAASLGFTLDYSVRDGYFPPDTIIFTTMAAAKSNVAANVDVLYNNLMAADGSIEAYHACVTVVDNGNGTYTTTVYYG